MTPCHSPQFPGPLPAASLSELLRDGGGGCPLLAPLPRLLREENRVDVRQYAATTDRDLSHVLVELLVVTDGELDVPGDDPVLLLILGSVPCELKDLRRDVFNHRCEVDRRTARQAATVATALQLLGEAVHWEDKVALLLPLLAPRLLGASRLVLRLVLGHALLLILAPHGCRRHVRILLRNLRLRLLHGLGHLPEASAARVRMCTHR
mmetsp:Transcript_82416/g.167041  ORF Transcript_82416/g.167041 Transcript_82416/m.167041 type:complete len:208 (+) Transcript_82416:87-710(+)